MLSLNIFAYVILVLVSFSAMLSVYTPVANKSLQTTEFKLYMLPFSYILIFYAIGTVAIYFGFRHNDFIEPLTASRAFVPLGLAAVIFISGLLSSPNIHRLIVVACVAVTVWMQPLGEGFPFPQIPEWAAKIVLIAFFSVFCIFYSIMNSLPHIMIVPSVILLLGISILSALSAAPLYLALSSAILIGPLCGYLGINFNMVKVSFDNGSCSALAYLISNIFLLDASEFSFSSCIVFTTIFWAEFIVALWYRYVVVKSGDLSEHTFYAQAADKYNMRTLLVNITRICAVALFIGWFQLYSVNQFSLIIVCLAIIFWLNFSFVHPSEKKNLKQINQGFISDIKQNISDFKSSLSQIQSHAEPDKNKTGTQTPRKTKTETPVRKRTKKTKTSPRKKKAE